MNSSLIEIQLLGGFAVRVDGRLVRELSALRLQAVLAYLLLHRGRPQNRAFMAAQLWPDVDETSAKTNLRKSLYKLRQLFPEVDSFLELDASMIVWQDGGGCILDVIQLERLLQLEPSRDRLAECLSLYRGDLLPGCYDEWLYARNLALKNGVLDYLARGARLLENQGDLAAALPILRRLVQEEPEEERYLEQLLHTHERLGDRAAALRVYQAYAGELSTRGEQPGAGLQAAFARLRGNDSPPGQPRSALPFVGRTQELRQLQAEWRLAMGGEARLALISGTGGIGKSRLVTEFRRSLQQQGTSVLEARCFQMDIHLSYAPLAELLRQVPTHGLSSIQLGELAYLLPGLRDDFPELPRQRPLEEVWQLQRFHRALTGILLRSAPLLICLDDLQWSDLESLRFLHQLLRWAPSGSLLVVATLCREEANDGDFLQTGLLPLLQRDGRLTELVLEPFTLSETAQLSAAYYDAPQSESEVRRLLARTGGNALFTVETLRTAERLSGDRSPQGLPPTVQALIEARLSRLPEQALQCLTVAAVIGDAFDVEVLAQLIPVSEADLIASLELLARRNLLTEQVDGSYVFAHGQVQEVALSRLSLARRRLLHRQLGDALLRTSPAHDPRKAARVARHLELGGDLAGAIPQLLGAAQACHRLFAHEDAVRHYRRVLALVQQAPNVEFYQQALEGLLRVAVVHVAIEDIQTLIEQAEESLRVTPNLARLAELRRLQARRADNLGLNALVRKFAQDALELARAAGAIDTQVLALLLLGKERILHRAVGQGIAYFEEGLALSLELDAPHLTAQVRMHLAIADTQAGQLTRADQLLEENLALMRALHDRRFEAVVLIHLALNRSRQGLHPIAIEMFKQARRLVEELQSPQLLSGLLTDDGIVKHEHGAFRAALQAFEEARTLYEQARLTAEHPVLLAIMARSLLYLGQLDRARALAEQAFKEFRLNGEERMFLHLQVTLLEIANAQGDPSWTRLLVEDGRRLLDQQDGQLTFDHRLEAARLELQLALAYGRAGEKAESARWLNQAEAELQALRYDCWLRSHRVVRAELLVSAQRWEEALGCLEPLVADLEEEQSGLLRPHLVWYLHSQVLQALGRGQEARRSLRRAHQRLQSLLHQLKSPEERVHCLSDVVLHRQLMETWNAMHGMP